MPAVNSKLRPWELVGAPRPPESSTSQPAPRPSINDLEAAVVEHEAGGATDVDGRFIWGAALVAEGRNEAALSAFAPVLAQPDAPGRVFVVAGVAAQAAGQPFDHPRLETMADRLAAGTDADIAHLWMTAGGLLMQAGLHERAAGAFDRASTLYSKDSDTLGLVWALREAAQTAAFRQRTQEANALVRRALRYSPHDEMTLLLRLDEARFFALESRWPDAITSLKAAQTAADQTMVPNHPLMDHLQVSLAAAYMESEGPSDKALRLLERAFGARRARGTETDPESAEVMLLLGEHHRLSRRFDDALPLIARAALARESNGEGPLAAAHAYGIWAQALEDKGLMDAADEKRSRADALRAQAETN